MPSVARIRPDREGIREQANLFGKGITPSFDHAGRVVEIRFSELTESEARDWLNSQNYRDFTIETEPEKHEGKRYLTVELAPGSDIQEVDGGLLVPSVKLLAPGVWTDSTQKTPCRYTPAILERYFNNWTDLSYWSRHSGGSPRDITDRIANIQNVRYQEGIVADLFFHGATSKSQDAISLLKAAAAKKVPWPFSSVEMWTRDKWIISEKLYEAQEVLFDGAAMVNQGACRVCRIRNNEWVQDDPKEVLMEKKKQQAPAGSLEETQEILQRSVSEKFGKQSDDGPYGAWILATFADRCIYRAPDGLTYEVPYTISNGEVTLGEPTEVEITYEKKEQESEMTENKELEAQVEALKKELADLKAAQKPPEPPKMEVPKELTESITTLTEEVKTLSSRVETLEKEPGDPATKGSDPKELSEAPEYLVPVDRKAGIVGE